MISEIYASLKDNFKKRATNPFLGTFTIVYIIHNWELFYSLLYFDSSLNLEGRLGFIRGYFLHHSFFENLIWSIVYTILTLIGTYILLSVGRIAADIYEFMIVPRIKNNIDKGQVVTRELYKRVSKERDDFQRMYDTEHEINYKLRDKIKNQESEIEDFYSNQNQNNIDTNSENTNVKITEDNVDLLYDEVIHKKYIETFDKMVDDTFKRSKLEMNDIYTPPKDFFVKHDIFITKPIPGGLYYLEITPKGKKLQSKILSAEKHKRTINLLKKQ